MNRIIAAIIIAMMAGSGCLAYQITNYTTADGLVDNSLRAIATDTGQTVWFGTNGGGVSKFKKGVWTSYKTTDGLAKNWVNAVAVDGSGIVWFGTSNSGVSAFGGTFKTYTTADGLAGDWVTAIAIDRMGHPWFGTRGDGISSYNGSVWAAYKDTAGIGQGSEPFSYVNSIAVDTLGRVWAGTSGGVSMWNGASFKQYTAADGLGASLVRAILIDKKGVIWAGTSGGVSKFQAGVWTNIPSTINGLISDDVNAIALDSTGNLWFGTNGGGLSKFTGTAWANYTTSSGLLANTIFALAVDSSNALWIGTSQGVSKLVEGSGARISLQRVKSGRTVLVGPAQSALLLTGFNPPAQVSIYDARGSLLVRAAGPGGRLDISALSSGTYVVKINAGGESFTATVVKGF
jgi:ligand-binding sensor domain-containing protein